jgi:hypothetical protein
MVTGSDNSSNNFQISSVDGSVRAATDCNRQHQLEDEGEDEHLPLQSLAYDACNAATTVETMTSLADTSADMMDTAVTAGGGSGHRAVAAVELVVVANHHQDNDSVV